jgi:uracil-DNA glycosylase family 4
MTRDRLGKQVEDIRAQVVACRRCPRLVAWREKVARDKRAAFVDETYWGKPVPGFGDPRARVVVVGLAPAAHGANRTGRMFTGDRSGDWLYRALYRAGFANRPESTHREDGLILRDCYVTAAVRCAPPGNKPSPVERDSCRPYLESELAALERARVLVALGKFAFDQLWRILQEGGDRLPSPRPRFAHGMEITVRPNLTLMASFHPSQQNTFTGKLTEGMFDAVWARARELVS